MTEDAVQAGGHRGTITVPITSTDATPTTASSSGYASAWRTRAKSSASCSRWVATCSSARGSWLPRSPARSIPSTTPGTTPRAAPSACAKPSPSRSRLRNPHRPTADPLDAYQKTCTEADDARVASENLVLCDTSRMAQLSHFPAWTGIRSSPVRRRRHKFKASRGWR